MQDDTGATIYGTDFDTERCEEIMFGYFLGRLRLKPGKLPGFSNRDRFPEMGRLEMQLFRKKWFDYRFLHPVQATYFFAYCYEQAYRVAFKRHISRDRAEYVKVLKTPDLFENRAQLVHGMWKARGVADAIGAPYPFFLEASMRHTLSYWRQKYLPQPNHLYADWVLEKVIREWEEVKQHRVFHAENAAYRAPNFTGIRDQIEHRDFLIETARTRADPTTLLVSFVDKELLTLDHIALRLGQDVAERVQEAA